MGYCINLKKRKNKPFCKLFNKEVNLSVCYCCNDKKYTKKAIQKLRKLKHSTYKHIKADSKRFSLITDDLEHCIICGRKKEALHEVFYGAYRHVSIKYGMIIPLCLNHHTQGKFSVHKDRELDLYYKRLCESIFINKYSYELYMKEFKINYIKKD